MAGAFVISGQDRLKSSATSLELVLYPSKALYRCEHLYEAFVTDEETATCVTVGFSL